MRKLVVTEFVTLEGVMEDPGGAEKSKYGGWAFQFERGPEGDKFKLDELSASDTLLLGRVTYEGFAAVWPGRTDEAGFADRLNNLPKYVVSTTLAKAEWNNSTIINKDVVEEISKLKQQAGKDILLTGSARLVQTLIQHDLVDQFNLMVYPIVVGGGKRLFQDGSRASLKLVESKTFGSGVIGLIYQPIKKG